jgi:peptidoglycan/LPS O-acetylase OafA/YrhL
MKPLSPPIKRNESLDYLRGLAATGVMFYHLSLFSFGESDASTFIARVKIYAVSIFYVLSGLTLYIANTKLLELTKNSLIEFYLKRFFRIFPLLWLATMFTYLLKSSPDMYTIKHLIVNITIVPGMLRADAFEANGAWSIGNELFFYVFFPVLFFIYKKSKAYLLLAVVLIFAAFCAFTFKLINPTINLGYQWSKYVNPFNQFFYFAIGIYIATFKKPVDWLVKLAPLLIVVCLAVIALYPQSGEPVVLVTGVTRLVLSAFVIAMCYLFYISEFNFFPSFLKKALKYLGDTSYAIYLIHPLVHIIVHSINEKYLHWNAYLVIAATVAITIPLSGVVYEHFEKYFMRLGKKTMDNRRSKVSNIAI